MAWRVIRLLGKVASTQGGHAEKKRAVMDGLCEMVDVEAWVWGLGCQIEQGGPQTYAGIMHGGFNEDRYTRWLKAVEHSDMGKGAFLFFDRVVRTQDHTTMERAEVDSDGFVEGEGAGALWDEADIGSLIMSGFPVDEKSISCVGFYRRMDEPVFSAEEIEVIHIVLSEVEWLHHAGWPEDRGVSVPKLAPQQRIVLNLMLDGLSRKEIASSMELSIHTINEYARGVFRHFGVGAQSELINSFLG